MLHKLLKYKLICNINKYKRHHTDYWIHVLGDENKLASTFANVFFKTHLLNIH